MMEVSNFENGSGDFGKFSRFFWIDSPLSINADKIHSLKIHSSFSCRKYPKKRYELVGVVVHSGQANAGHYYSYIKDRR